MKFLDKLKPKTPTKPARALGVGRVVVLGENEGSGNFIDVSKLAIGATRVIPGPHVHNLPNNPVATAHNRALGSMVLVGDSVVAVVHEYEPGGLNDRTKLRSTEAVVLPFGIQEGLKSSVSLGSYNQSEIVRTGLATIPVSRNAIVRAGGKLDPSVSESNGGHADIIMTQGGTLVADKDSANGTFIIDLGRNEEGYFNNSEVGKLVGQLLGRPDLIFGSDGAHTVIPQQGGN